MLDVTFKGMEIRDALLDELRTDESAGIVPELTVGGKDGIAEEVKPSGMEELALAIIVELRRQNSLNVLRIRAHNETLP